MEKTCGIVLGSVRLTGDKVIVRIFTGTRGTVPFLVRVSRARGAAVRGVLLRPLYSVDIDYDFRPTRELQTLGEVHLRTQYVSLLYEPVKQTMALFLGEFLTHALKHESENAPLLDYLEKALCELDEAGSAYTAMHLDIVRGVAEYLGYGAPQLRSMTLAELMDYFRINVPEFPELKSLAVLRDVLH